MKLLSQKAYGSIWLYSFYFFKCQQFAENIIISYNLFITYLKNS